MVGVLDTSRVRPIRKWRASLALGGAIAAAARHRKAKMPLIDSDSGLHQGHSAAIANLLRASTKAMIGQRHHSANYESLMVMLAEWRCANNARITSVGYDSK